MGICYIFGASPTMDSSYINKDIKENDFVICADGGYKLAQKCNIKPNLLVGDFDSGKYIESNIKTIRLNPEKDDTDIEHSFNEGVKLGYKEFVLYGAIGGRFDHTIANIQLLVYALNKGIKITIYDEKNIITAIKNERINVIKDENYKYFSIFSYSDTSYGVTLNGMKYSLNDYTLTNYSCGLTVSNEIVDDFATVEVKDGILIIIKSRD